MNLYKINDALFLHEKSFNHAQLQDAVSGMMMEYRKEIVPQYQEVAQMRKSHNEHTRKQADAKEESIPNPYVFFEKYGFMLVEVEAHALTHLEVLEDNNNGGVPVL